MHESIHSDDTRCNYANSSILRDHLCGTFRAGEGTLVGQYERVRLTIRQQLLFPLRPLIALFTAKQGL